MPNVKELIAKIESGDISYEEKLAALSQVEASLQEMKAKKDERIKFNVQIIIDEIKKIKQDVQAQLDYARSIIPERGPKGDPGERGRDGSNGVDGAPGRDGRDGKDGKDGQDGVSVTDAKIDFDGSLVITLSTGREINVGEVVSPDLAEKIKVTMSTNSSLTVSDEGSVLTNAVRNINFVGATVTASNAGDDVTVNVSAGTGSVTSVDVSGGTTGLTTSGGPVTTSGTITLAGTLAVANGGTGQTSYTNGQLLIGNTTGNTLAKATLTQGSGIAITNGAGSITIANADTQTFSQVIFTVNTVTVSSNAGTVPITHRLHTFTNSSAAAMTVTLATASAVDGQMAIVRIFDFSAAAQTINWVNTENSTVTVPTTSNGSTTLPLTVGFMYNNATSKWRCVASA